MMSLLLRPVTDVHIVFNSRCTKCQTLALAISAISDGAVQPVDLHATDVPAWLEPVMAGHWDRGPMLIFSSRRKVRVFHGWSAAFKLLQMIGPSRAWQLFCVARSIGVRAFPLFMAK